MNSFNIKYLNEYSNKFDFLDYFFLIFASIYFFYMAEQIFNSWTPMQNIQFKLSLKRQFIMSLQFDGYFMTLATLLHFWFFCDSTSREHVS